MSILSAERISIRFGPKVLLEEADLALEPQDRIGVVGPNGAGKSTLLRILAGLQAPDGGRVVRARGVRVGYLAQEHGDVADASLVDSLLRSAPGRAEVEARITEAEGELSACPDPDTQMEWATRLSELHETAAEMDRRFGRHRAERILEGLGFASSDFGRPLTAFSGGWRMRAELGRLLYQQNDILILDEPTNHLDVPTIEWLSEFLERSRQCLVLTCHDRLFLNRHVRRVASLELEGLRTFRGDYDAYLAQREQDLAHLEARAAKYEKKKKELEAFVTRFKAKASKARQAQSKNKLIEKMTEGLEEVPRHRPSIHVRLPSAKRAGDRVLALENLEFGYGERSLFRGLSAEVRRGSRIALLGRNGAGKSTLLKLMAQELSPRAGRVRLGAQVEPRYFAQHQSETLGGHGSVLEAVAAANPEASHTQVRSMCGAFLFRGDDVDKPVDVLSGGERSRVALARILIRPGNLLLLDEPTNHLDTESADALTESLASFDGTLVFVSHSLDFIRRLANVIWDVRPDELYDHPGSFDDYLFHLKEARRSLFENGAKPGAKAVAPADGETKEARKAARARVKEWEARVRRARRRVEEAEARVASLEAKKADLETALADPALHADPDASRKTARAYEKLKAELDAAVEAWGEAESEVAAADSAAPPLS